MTCNPNWLEIKRELTYVQSVQNRPYILPLVVRMKMKHVIHELVENMLLGVDVADILVVVFHKRGISHVAEVRVVVFHKRGVAHGHWFLELIDKERWNDPEHDESIKSAEITPQDLSSVNFFSPIWFKTHVESIIPHLFAWKMGIMR